MGWLLRFGAEGQPNDQADEFPTLALLSNERAAPLQLFIPSSLLFDHSGARDEIALFEAKRYSEMNG